MENLFAAWREFKKGKEKKRDVQEFALNLEKKVFELHADLVGNQYQHSQYTAFSVCDPKPRRIHKASVRDRLLHHAITRVIEPIFERTFIFDSYSSRQDKGTHRAIQRFHQFAWKLSRNRTRTVWVLQCDIRKFFDSVDHAILIDIISKRIKDGKTRQLIEKIICSFVSPSHPLSISPSGRGRGIGIPLGNLTSQLLANVYLNELDQFVKRTLRIKHYVRYADDFAIVSYNRIELENMIPLLDDFLRTYLKLSLHPRKVTIKKFHRGIDFLGYVIFPTHAILRTKTKRRMFKKIAAGRINLNEGRISEESFHQSVQSYLGMLQHCRAKGLGNIVSKIRGCNGVDKKPLSCYYMWSI